MRSIIITMSVIAIVISTSAACAVGVPGPASEDCGVGYVAGGTFGEKTENCGTADAGHGYAHDISISYSCSRSVAPMDMTVTVDNPLPGTVYMLTVEDTFNGIVYYDGMMEGPHTVRIRSFGLVDVYVFAYFPDRYENSASICDIYIDGGKYNTFSWKYQVDDWWDFFGLVNNRSLSHGMRIPFSEFLEAKRYNGVRDDGFSDVLNFVRYEDRSVVSSLADWLKNVMSGRSDLELVNCALKFVQSIGYATDEDQYGRDEYYAFPVETLWSQKGDCEDHAILFASIVKAMGFDVALFKLSMDGMSQHIAAGVNVKGASGTSFEFEGKAYYYCETTSDVGDSYLNSWNVGSMTWGYNLWDIVLVPRSCSSAGARNTGIS